jgi:hypothetical protein
MSGALLSGFCGLSWASNAIETHATATVTKNTLISVLLVSISYLLEQSRILSPSNENKLSDR